MDIKYYSYLIIIVVFFLVLWFQDIDDKKRCKKRDNIYQTVKLPLLISSVVGIIIFWNDNDNIVEIKNGSSINQNYDVPVSPVDQNLELYTSVPDW